MALQTIRKAFTRNKPKTFLYCCLHGNHKPNCSYGCWENTQKAFSRVLPTSRVGYHASKPIESVIYCLNTQMS